MSKLVTSHIYDIIYNNATVVSCGVEGERRGKGGGGGGRVSCVCSVCFYSPVCLPVVLLVYMLGLLESVSLLCDCL